MKKLLLTLLISFPFLSHLVLSKVTAAESITTTFQADSANIANPERGTLHDQGDCETQLYSATTMKSFRTNEQITLIMCNFYLPNFKNSPISDAVLQHLKAQLSAIRSAGIKVILRFAYTESRTGDDTNLAQIQEHIDQLSPILQSNRDVIALWQAGFVGAWGEWYYTQNFGNQGTITSANWADRKAIVDKMLAALPGRFVSLRTPLFKRTMYSGAALTAQQAFDGSAISRIGHHNDAFVASSSDYGTYVDKTVEYPYLAAETKYVPMGGENDNYAPPRSDCPTALSEMSMFHWSYINEDYYLPTLDAWISQGCMPTIKKQLGYRFVLKNATYPNVVNPGGTLPLSISIANEGFAAPFNPRPIFAVLFNDANSYSMPLTTDPRTWQGQNSYSFNLQANVPSNIPSGSYKLALWLPDESTSLHANPAYSIRFANLNTWDAVRGYNVIGSNIVVDNSSPAPFTGDLDGDGSVTLFDYNKLISEFGNPYTIFNYNTLLANFGR